MSQRASVYVVRRIPTDGGESPNRFVPQITIEIRVFFPPHTSPATVADQFLTVAAETMNEIRGYIDEERRNVWLTPPITVYSAAEIAKMDDFASQQNAEQEELGK